MFTLCPSLIGCTDTQSPRCVTVSLQVTLSNRPDTESSDGLRVDK